jgi:acetolactate synthase-1/2/3 large subunit
MSSTATKSTMQTGAELLVKSLEAQGVEYIFGIPGAKIDKVFDSLLDSKIKTIVCRHEQNASFLAGGIGRMTGRAGVVLVTSGSRAWLQRLPKVTHLSQSAEQYPFLIA